LHRPVGNRVDHRADIRAERGEVITGFRRVTSSVASDLHHDCPASEQRHDFDVVVGDIGHAGDEDDRPAPIGAISVEVMDAGLAVFGEA
jgi:hypothetical protein